VKTPADSVSTIALTFVPRLLRRRRSAAALRTTRGLDENGKISKDIRMTAMPRIGAAELC
jgi:hypothetical protein